MAPDVESLRKVMGGHLRRHFDAGIQGPPEASSSTSGERSSRKRRYLADNSLRGHRSDTPVVNPTVLKDSRRVWRVSKKKHTYIFPEQVTTRGRQPGQANTLPNQQQQQHNSEYGVPYTMENLGLRSRSSKSRRTAQSIPRPNDRNDPKEPVNPNSLQKRQRFSKRQMNHTISTDDTIDDRIRKRARLAALAG
jgi:hypothetical protein